MVGEVMGHVAEDQAKFILFDPSKPAPAMIKGTPGAPAGGSGGAVGYAEGMTSQSDGRPHELIG